MPTALITGTSTGFGRVTTEVLAARGWRVFATMRDLKRKDPLERALRMLDFPTASPLCSSTSPILHRSRPRSRPCFLRPATRQGHDALSRAAACSVVAGCSAHLRASKTSFASLMRQAR